MDRGFTLIETVIAMTLMLLLTGVVLAVVNPHTLVSQTQPEAVDVQQRARVATDTLFRDLFMAGAGVDSGPRTGPLVDYFAPVIPRRLGLSGADASTAVRSDAITMTWISGTWSQTTTISAMLPLTPDLAVAAPPNCPAGEALCGLVEGTEAVVFDEEGHFDVFTVGPVTGGVGRLQLHDRGESYPYRAGAYVAASTTRTYYLDAANRQLRFSDGYLTDVPVVDHVVGLEFSYFGDPDPPARPRPPLGTANCLYDAAGHALGNLPTLAREGGSLAPLPLSMLNDGPWCGANGSRFDADLLRVRKVRVTLRVEATQSSFRGTGEAFVGAGTSRSGGRTVPDYLLGFEVAPRNLHLSR